VAAGAGAERVLAGAADENVAAGPPEQLVTAGPADDDVVRTTAARVEIVVAVAAEQVSRNCEQGRATLDDADVVVAAVAVCDHAAEAGGDGGIDGCHAVDGHRELAAATARREGADRGR